MSDDWQVVERSHVRLQHDGRRNFIQDCATCAALARLREREAQPPEEVVAYFRSLYGTPGFAHMAERVRVAEARVQELEREKADADATWGQQLADMQDRVEELEAAAAWEEEHGGCFCRTCNAAKGQS